MDSAERLSKHPRDMYSSTIVPHQCGSCPDNQLSESQLLGSGPTRPVSSFWEPDSRVYPGEIGFEPLPSPAERPQAFLGIESQEFDEQYHCTLSRFIHRGSPCSARALSLSLPVVSGASRNVRTSWSMLGSRSQSRYLRYVTKASGYRLYMLSNSH
ncbi:hypothetical protein K439DRAFT_121959 [Ramaria rubella]|nr:hypothetical protein K439DRAFT_121959 [Ramaria rubella]